jgi:hypothetical protein
VNKHTKSVIITILLIILGIGGYDVARGHEDYGQSMLSNFAGVTADVGEVAARLGSPVTYFRTGKVVFIEDFNDDITGWKLSPSNATTITHETNMPIIGKGSLLFTHDAAHDDSSFIRKYIPYAGQNKVGLEVTMSAPDTCPKRVYVQLGVVRDTTYYVLRFRFEGSSGNVSVYTEASGDVLIATLTSPFETDYAPIIFKLTGDLDSLKYGNLWINNDRYDISEYEIYQGVVATEDYIKLEITAYNTLGQTDPLLIDNFIVTVDEP